MAGGNRASAAAAAAPLGKAIASVSPWKEAWRRFKRHRLAYWSLWVLAFMVLAVLVGPYLFNCWRVFGDPLYAINYHTGNYLVAEGAATLSPPSAAEYIGAKVFDHPYRTFDTALLGVTSYPFFVKWRGFDPWGAWLGRSLSAAAVVGFVVLLGFPSGRLLLFVALMSQLPFSVTWTVAPDWRFTEHLYPFFLITSFVPLTLALRGVWPLVRPWPERMARSGYFWGSVVCGIGEGLAADARISSTKQKGGKPWRSIANFMPRLPKNWGASPVFS